MTKKNSVFIATSLDGFIADADGGIDWLHTIPNSENDDMGYGQFMSNIDALIMGRATFETVLGFEIEWPYDKPVYVLSQSLKTIPDNLKGRVHLMRGDLEEVLTAINSLGHNRLYIDGGRTIRSFLKADLIDEMIITTIPVLLGGGIPLFHELPKSLEFQCIDTTLYLDFVVQNHFVRRRGQSNLS